MATKTLRKDSARTVPVRAHPTGLVADVSSGVSPQVRPIVYRDSNESIHCAVKVDSAVITGAIVEVTGWTVGRTTLGLTVDGQSAKFDEARFVRPDVSKALGIPDRGEQLGFTLKSRRAKGGGWALTLQAQTEVGMVEQSYPLDLERKSAPRADIVSQVVGSIEAAASSTRLGQAVVAGWVLSAPDVRVWLETEDDLAHDIGKAFRVFRADVNEAHRDTFGNLVANAGFIFKVDGIAPGETLRLVAEGADGRTVLSEARCESLSSDPTIASRWLFGIATPLSQFHRRLAAIDSPIIDALIRFQVKSHQKLPVEARQLGSSIASPLVSVVVPLYGRIDFVEHQLLEFWRDSWFVENVELIYVLDDPNLADRFTTLAESLHRLYQLPFKWLWGAANRGYSGANNLGASVARGQQILFLNSDAFPQSPGWLPMMVDALNRNKKIGAIGPRLVFGDGSIQHAGMEFLRREDLGVWVNHHPNMGLQASLDPAKTLTEVPAATGACLLISRQVFEQVGGWDMGYLIGDFEDSDICLKLRSAGYQIGYLPSVQLTHLERQSFRLLGNADYRTRVVIYNAVRHQDRWSKILDSGPE